MAKEHLISTLAGKVQILSCKYTKYPLIVRALDRVVAEVEGARVLQ